MSGLVLAILFLGMAGGRAEEMVPLDVALRLALFLVASVAISRLTLSEIASQ